MADYCSHCTEVLFPTMEPDIDTKALASELTDDYPFASGFLCEGCGLLALEKKGDKVVGYYYSDQGSPEERNWPKYTLDVIKRREG